MKTLFKKFVEKTANTKLFRLYQSLTKPYQYSLFFRMMKEDARYVQEKFPDLVVRNGPFKGMRYPCGKSAGSAILPKLLGSYERELLPVLKRILQNNYTEIIDIGSAEGYYAIGLGMRFPQAKIFAFDTDAKANQLCLEMAKLNGVESRLNIGAFCDDKTLLAMHLHDKALLISDCEGYEIELFTPAVVAELTKHDLLIECHDSLNNVIIATLQERFEKTHAITVIESIDDAKKVRTYDFPELASCDEAAKLFILSERRPITMNWLCLTSRISSQGR